MPAVSPPARLLALAAAATVLLFAPATASASTVTKSGNTITYEAAAGEDNGLNITQAGGNITFDEQTVVIVDGGGCPLAAGNAVCAEGGVTKIVVNLGDLDDSASLQTSALPLTASGGPGRDGLSGGSGADVLRGEAGDDNLSGGDGGDTLDGGDGNDGHDGGPGNDTIDGGGGRDAAIGDEGNDIINAGPGPDNTLQGGDGNDTVNGQGGSDGSIAGGPGSDTINGGDGDDAIESDDGADVIGGGGGRDRYSATTTNVDVSLTLDGNANDGAAGEGDNIGVDVEDVFGGQGNDTIIGSAASNSLDGQDGNDTISGGDGFDSLFGNDGNDVVNGDGGGDSLNGGDGEDVVNGGADADLLRAAGGSDVLNGGDGTDFMEPSSGDGPDAFNGGSGVDTISWRDFEQSVVVTLDGAANDGFAGAGDNVAADVETLVGSAADDTLSGGPGFNVIDGGFGNDTIAIRDGAADAAVCGDGSDTVTADGVDLLDPSGGGCETIDRGAGSAPGRIGRIGSATHRRGIVTVTLTCPLDAVAGCSGTAVMTSSGLGTIGRASFLFPTGSEKTVRISLSKKARSRLNSKRRLRVSLRLSGADLRGPLTTRTVTFTIKR